MLYSELGAGKRLVLKRFSVPPGHHYNAEFGILSRTGFFMCDEPNMHCSVEFSTNSQTVIGARDKFYHFMAWICMSMKWRKMRTAPIRGKTL